MTRQDTTLLLCTVFSLLLPGRSTAQHVTRQSESHAQPDTSGTLSVMLESDDSPGMVGSDRNLAFGHSGATFKFIPRLATRWGQISPLSATLRFDARDGLSEVGVPARLHMRLNKPDWLNTTLDIGLGFDHLGVAILMQDPGEFGLSKQSTQHMALDMSHGAWSWGIAAGHKRYTAALSEELEIDRSWMFAQLHVRWQFHERLGLEVSGQSQQWLRTQPGDFMQQDDLSLTYQTGLQIKATDEVTLQATGGLRQDTPKAAARLFGGVQATWSPEFGRAKTDIPASETE